MARKVLIRCNFTHDADAKISMISAAIARYGLKDCVDFQSAPGDSNLSISDQDTQNADFVTPFYIGSLLKRIKVLLDTSEKQETLAFCDHALDLVESCLQTPNGDKIRLTEKETALLEILHAANGKKIEGAELLKAIWGYADDTETHTVATHIYRLRQKIEPDPNTPELVITDETGYRLTL